VGKAPITFSIGSAQGRCLACKNLFIGPGQRCQPCQQKLRKRKRRKPR
jgi:rRNA maturation endonuclease Nob1